MISVSGEFQTKYLEAKDYMTQIIRSEEDAYWIIWRHFTALVEMMPLSGDGLAEFFGLLQSIDDSGRDPQQILNSRDSADNELFQRIEGKYAFSPEVQELGTVWKKEIADIHPSRVKRVYAWLEHFEKDVLHYVFDLFHDYIDARPGLAGVDEDTIYKWERNYLAYRSQLKRAADTLFISYGVLTLVNASPDE